MKKARVAILILLAACGAKASDLTLTIAGVTMADVEAVKSELAKVKGVRDVRAGALKDGQVTIILRYAGRGGGLAAELARSSGGLRNVKGFDDTSVQISYDDSAQPVVATVAEKKGEEKEIKVEAKKDPLAYKVHQLSGGTIATFENWKIVPVGNDGNWTAFDTTPAGREADFVLRVVYGMASEGELANIFTTGPQIVQQFLGQLSPDVRQSEAPRRCTFGGDEAMVEGYAAEAQGKKLSIRVAYIRKKDVAVGVMGIGTEAGFKEFGRAIEIVAQSISFKESPLEPALVGTWALEKYYQSSAYGTSDFSYSSGRYVTIYPNGTFTEKSYSAADNRDHYGKGSALLEGGDRGRLVKGGAVLTFHYDNGKTWSSEYKLEAGGGLWLGKTLYLKQ